MKKTLKLRLLESIGIVYAKSEDSNLEDLIFKKLDKELSFLSGYFKCSKSQALIASIVFVENYINRTTNHREIVGHLKCSPLRLLEFSDDFEKLVEMGILKTIYNRRGFQNRNNNFEEEFVINDHVNKAILNSQNIATQAFVKFANITEVLEKINDLADLQSSEEISADYLKKETVKLITGNKHIPLIEKVSVFKLSPEDSFLYLLLIWGTITCRRAVDVSLSVQYIFDSTSRRIEYLQKIINKDNDLIKLNLIELEEADYFNDTEMKLSEFSLDILEETGLKIFNKKLKKDNILEPDKIKQKTMIYNESEAKEIEIISNFMNDKKYQELQKNLDSKGLPKGITALFFGAPGTGKTETAYQLAKASGREIIMVDISQSKSMWFGESEKIVKRIFTDYREYAKQCEKTPILFFNEADAIISKRGDINSSNVAQTENTIQNILLDELERFDGIFFATTNLLANIDKAFERRFLFKIEFHQPCNSVRAKIWNLKLPKLSIKDADKLAEQFDFSGGQIDNIKRKCEMFEIMNSVSVGYNDIVEFCNAEKWDDNKRARIGFRK